MTPFPQIIDEDYQAISAIFDEFLEKSEAMTALLVEKAGYLILERGEKAPFDTAELATLAANSFAATQFMADRLSESNFTHMFQQGDETSVLWMNIEENSLLVAVFAADKSLGAVKFYAIDTAKAVAKQIKIAQDRDASGGVDLAHLDPTSADDVFKRKSDDEEGEAAPAPAG